MGRVGAYLNVFSFIRGFDAFEWSLIFILLIGAIVYIYINGTSVLVSDYTLLEFLLAVLCWAFGFILFKRLVEYYFLVDLNNQLLVNWEASVEEFHQELGEYNRGVAASQPPQIS